MAQGTPPREAQEPSPDQAASLHAPGALLHPLETARLESELLSRCEHPVTAGAQVQHNTETPRTSVVSRAPSPGAQLGIPHGEHDETDVVRRLMQLQHTVNELAATVAAQAAHLRDERQAQERERQTPPPRTVVVHRGDASSTMPRAFWERSRLGRLHLRTGR
jgi:hypothetical protein